jgi:hypothetical protein
MDRPRSGGFHELDHGLRLTEASVDCEPTEAAGLSCFYGPVEATPNASGPRLVGQIGDIAGVDRLVRQRRQLGEPLALGIGRRLAAFPGCG